MPFKIEISDDEVKDALSGALFRALHHEGYGETALSTRAQKALEEAVAEKVQEMVQGATEEAIRAEVARVLVEGWRKTNQYGEDAGEVINLKSMVLKVLTSSNNGYDRTSKIEEVARDEIGKALRGDLGKVLEEAKLKMRAMVDGSIAEKMREVLKDAFR